MQTAIITDAKEIIIRLIEQDFKMICIHDRLGAVGFNGDFPNISYEVWDLLGIPEKVQNGDLDDHYWRWAQASAGLEEGLEGYVGWVYEQLVANTG